MVQADKHVLSEAFELFTWGDFAHREPSTPKFLFPGFLPGTLGLLTAPTNTGKTWAALHLALAIAIGSALSTQWPVDLQGPVTYVNAEDPPNVIHQRVHRLMQSHSPQEAEIRFLFPRRRDIRLMDLSVDNRPQFNRIIQQHLENLATKQQLLILDPFNKFHALDENNNNHMNALIDALATIATHTHCAILLLHHEGKKGDSRGASAIPAGVQWHAELRPVTGKASKSSVPGGRLVILKNRWGSVPPLLLRWGEWTENNNTVKSPTVNHHKLITPEEYFNPIAKETETWHDKKSQRK